MPGYKFIEALTEVFRAKGTAGNDVVIRTPGGHYWKPTRVRTNPRNNDTIIEVQEYPNKEVKS